MTEATDPKPIVVDIGAAFTLHELVGGPALVEALDTIEFLKSALQRIADYSPSSTVQPVAIARATLKGEKW